MSPSLQRCNTEVAELSEANQICMNTAAAHFVTVDEVPVQLADLPTLKFNKCESMEYSCSGSKLITSHKNGAISLWNA